MRFIFSHARLWLGLGTALQCFATSTASAETGEVGFGVDVAATVPLGVRVTGLADVGFAPWWAVRANVGMERGERTLGLADAGIVAVWDVVRWVPELYLGAGCSVGGEEIRERILARLGLRTFVGFDQAVTLFVAGEWRPDDWLGIFGVGWYAPQY